MEVEEIKIVLRAWSEKNSIVRKTYLFGSRARKDFRADSDIDIAVQLNKLPQDGSEYSTWMFSADELKKSLGSLLPFELQLEWYCPNSTPTVHKGIMESSILVYDQKNPYKAFNPDPEAIGDRR
ncbi:nucleotidyltransferase domain-containing protein [Saccharophagus degradans]|uniref:nucleotidyltransferase domain-containing protein n=1 Tax=Saccharophagus degradans TaxID=86304 RepID=UPI001C096E0A|nr:nucleotidyltransferase domain-containing protein [Saccharophagus degradans]MBU2984998.1 nucleotidyltransferase domain-containing protein [Saccharophagus degradans]